MSRLWENILSDLLESLIFVNWFVDKMCDRLGIWGCVWVLFNLHIWSFVDIYQNCLKLQKGGRERCLVFRTILFYLCLLDDTFYLKLEERNEFCHGNMKDNRIELKSCFSRSLTVYWICFLKVLFVNWRDFFFSPEREKKLLKYIFSIFFFTYETDCYSLLQAVKNIKVYQTVNISSLLYY